MINFYIKFFGRFMCLYVTKNKKQKTKKYINLYGERNINGFRLFSIIISVQLV